MTTHRIAPSILSADFGRLSQLDLFPETGRKHQLRVHCAQGLGTPILGDLRYGPNETLRTRGLFLFSLELLVLFVLDDVENRLGILFHQGIKQYFHHLVTKLYSQICHLYHFQLIFLQFYH